MLKRAFDIAVSGAGLAITGVPILMGSFLMAAITGESGIYKQQRIGLNGKPFTIYKIRTMSEKRDTDGQLLSDEERTGKIGSLMRRTRFDELPQFWNVLKGDMSLVGPRPAHAGQALLANDRKRHLVQPGVTGLAFMKVATSHDERLKLDVDHSYVTTRLNGTFWERTIMDVKIIAKTPFMMFHHVRQPHFNHSGQLSKVRRPS